MTRTAVTARSDVVIIGAGGHAKVVLDVVLANQLQVIGFVDDRLVSAPDPRFTVLGRVAELEDLMRRYPAAKIVIAVGDNKVRQMLDSKWVSRYGTPVALAHPYGFASPHAAFGDGTVLMPGVVVNSGTHVGRHVILNTSCSVDHDCDVGDYAHVSPGARLSGEVRLGMGCHVGTGASLIPGVKVGEWAVVGAGAVVTSDIPPRAVAVGVPARVVKFVSV